MGLGELTIGFLILSSVTESEGIPPFPPPLHCVRCAFSDRNCLDGHVNKVPYIDRHGIYKWGRALAYRDGSEAGLQKYFQTKCKSIINAWCVKILIYVGPNAYRQPVRRDCWEKLPPDIPRSTCFEMTQEYNGTDYPALFCSCNNEHYCNYAMSSSRPQNWIITIPLVGIVFRYIS